MRRVVVPLLLIASAVLVLRATAWAGPPLICHPVEIGDARSLPWGDDAFRRDRSLKRDRAVELALEILDSDAGMLVHMETLRRATMYVHRDRELAVLLHARLMARILDAEAAGRPSAAAWFDAGYLAQCYDQINCDVQPSGTAHGVAGYAWVMEALRLAPDDAEMQFGAAMMTALADIPQHGDHVVRTRELASPGSLTMRNLEHHERANWPHFRRD